MGYDTRVTLDDLPLPACVLDGSAQLVSANRAWRELLMPVDWDSNRLAWLAALEPADRQNVVASVRKSARTRSPLSHIAVVTGPPVAPIELFGSWLADGKGILVLVRILTADRNVGGQLELAPAESVRRRILLEQAFLTQTDAMLVLDCGSSLILEANPAAGRLYGRAPEQFRLGGLSDLTADAVPVAGPLAGRRERVPPHFHRRYDGSRFPAEMLIRYFQVEGRDLALVVIREIDSCTPQERAQLESELKYRAVFAAAPYPILILGSEGLIVDVNPSATALYGRSREQMLGLHARHLFADESPIHDLFSVRPAFVPPTAHRRRDGSCFLAETTLSFINRGDNVLALAVVRDVTEERKTLERLREAEERWRFALEGAGDGVWDWNIQSNEFYHSPRWREMLGYDDTPDLAWYKLLHPDDKQYVYGNVDAYLRGEMPLYQAEFRLRCADATYRWFAARGKILARDATGKPLRMLGTHRDITESRLMMESVRASEQRWQFALEGHGDGLWDWDLRSGQFALSRQFKQILGYRPEELDEGFYWDDLTHPDERRRTGEQFDHHLAGRTPLLSAETRLRCKDGSYRWVALRGKIMEYGVLDRPSRMIGTLRDIEAIKQREGKERNEQEKLAHAGRLITLGEMASALAHELNQPLTAIRNFSALGLRSLGDQAPANVKATFEIIAEQALRAGEIVRRVRSFVRKGEVSFAPVDINAVVTDMCRFAELDALAAGVQIVLELQHDLPAASGDRSSLEQLVMNLIKNGIEAMGASKSERRLTICTALRAVDSIECSVCDLGDGLSEKVRAGLFEPFVTTKPDGVGLGLAICRTIVENHGGRLWVEPARGRGTVFRFSVPMAGKGQHD